MAPDSRSRTTRRLRAWSTDWVQALQESRPELSESEARLRVSEAEVKAEKLLDAAHRRVGQLDEQIREIHGLRARLASGLRSTLETHLVLVDALSGDPKTAEAGSEDGVLPNPVPGRSEQSEIGPRHMGSEAD